MYKKNKEIVGKYYKFHKCYINIHKNYNIYA